MLRPKMILLDLDGTLVDSVPDLAYCVDRMMERLGRPPWGEARVRDWVGNGVERLVRRALTGSLVGEPSEADFARALPIFMALYSENTAVRSRLFPGVREGLAYLSWAGYPLACVTNKASQFTEPLLRALDVRDFFVLVVSGDTLAEKKPHPAPLLFAAEQLGIRPAEALMVGDSISDVRAARAAGFGAIICVSHGYNHGEDIREAGPDAVIDALSELPALLGPTDTEVASPLTRRA